MSIRFPLSILVSATLLRVAVVRAEDWPMWGRTPQRTLVTPEKDPPTDWNWDGDNPRINKNIKWSAELGSKSYGTPVVCAGVVYVGTNNFWPLADAKTRGVDGKPIDGGVLLAFREDTGSLLWQRYSAKLPSGRVNDWPGEGLCSSPCVDPQTQRLWYCTNRCEVVCLDLLEANRNLAGSTTAPADKLRESKVLWSVDMIKQLGVFPHNMTNCSPMVCGDLLYVITANGVDDTHKHVVAPDAPAIVCFDKNSGRVVWKDNSPGNRVLHSQWANPTLAQIGDTTLVIAPLGDGWVYAFEAGTGRIVWKFDANTKDSIYPSGGRNEIIAAPCIVDKWMYIATGQDPEHGTGYANFWCVDITKTGDISAEIDNLRYKAPGRGQELTVVPFVSKGVANPNSGVRWRFGPGKKGDKEGDRMHRSMAMATVCNGLAFITDFSGFVHCLDAETGKHYWSHDMDAEMWAGALACEGKLFVADGDGDVAVLAADKTGKLIAVHNMGSSIFCSPIYANGTLYVLSMQRLFALRANQPG